MPYNILVLEDMEERVNWLRKTFRFGVTVYHETSVEGFKEKFEQLESKGKLNIVILDHDLGGPFFDSSDKHGLTGTDAAKWLLTKQRKPTIIWSVNPEGSKRMRGFLPWAVHAPFINMDRLRTAIFDLMRLEGR